MNYRKLDDHKHIINLDLISYNHSILVVTTKNLLAIRKKLKTMMSPLEIKCKLRR